MSTIERLIMLIEQERSLHQETKRKLEKADHDRRRYKKRIRFEQARHHALAVDFHKLATENQGLKKANEILEYALSIAERRISEYEQAAATGTGAPEKEG